MSDPRDSASVLALCAAEDETDIGNGNRFRHRNVGDVLYMTKIGYHVYDGRRFREDEDDRYIRPFAHRTAEAIRFEAPLIVATDGELLLIEAGQDAEAEMERRGRPAPDASADVKRAWAKLEAAADEANDIKDKLADRRSSRAKYCKSSQNSGKLDNMLKEAAPYLSVTVDDMNLDPLVLNCRNGTVRYVRIEDEDSDPEDPRWRWVARLDEHCRDDRLTKMAEASVLALGVGKTALVAAEPSNFLYDSSTLNTLAHRAAPVFIEFIHRIMPGVDERAYLQRLLGYMLTGLTGEQMIAFFYGIGANGKSTLTDVVAKIMADYTVTLGIESFTGDDRRGGSDATPDLARLNGAYGCLASEGDANQKLKEGIIKKLTGDEKLAVRKLHKEFVEITIKAKFIITGNHKPDIRGADDGIWRRVQFLEFAVQIPPEERDRHLPDKLLAERDGILAWMLAGTLDFRTMGGLHPPPSVLAAVEEHREESDPVAAFIRNGCIVTGDHADFVSPGELYDGYGAYARREGLTPFGASTFNRRLPDKAKLAWKSPDGKMRQFVRMKSNGTVYRGIKIKEEFRGGGGGGAPVPEPDGREFAPQD